MLWDFPSEYGARKHSDAVFALAADKQQLEQTPPELTPDSAVQFKPALRRSSKTQLGAVEVLGDRDQRVTLQRLAEVSAALRRGQKMYKTLQEPGQVTDAGVVLCSSVLTRLSLNGWECSALLTQGPSKNASPPQILS